MLAVLGSRMVSPSMRWSIINALPLQIYIGVFFCIYLSTGEPSVSANIAKCTFPARMGLLATSGLLWLGVFPWRFYSTTKTAWKVIITALWITAAVGLGGLQAVDSPHPMHEPFSIVFFVCAIFQFMMISTLEKEWPAVVLLSVFGVILIVWAANDIVPNWPEYIGLAVIVTCWLAEVHKTALSLIEFITRVPVREQQKPPTVAEGLAVTAERWLQEVIDRHVNRPPTASVNPQTRYDPVAPWTLDDSMPMPMIA